MQENSTKKKGSIGSINILVVVFIDGCVTLFVAFNPKLRFTRLPREVAQRHAAYIIAILQENRRGDFASFLPLSMEVEFAVQ